MANAGNSDAPTNAQNAASSVHEINEEGGNNTGFVVVTYKVFPSDIISDFDPMKRKIESNLPDVATVHGYGEELVAYGLKALLVQVKFPEDKTGVLEEFEKRIESIEGVSQIQTLMVRRTSR